MSYEYIQATIIMINTGAQNNLVTMLLITVMASCAYYISIML